MVVIGVKGHIQVSNLRLFQKKNKKKKASAPPAKKSGGRKGNGVKSSLVVKGDRARGEVYGKACGKALSSM